MPPALSKSPCSDSISAWLSTMPVPGLSSAATQCRLGSARRAAAAVTSARSCTPFACPVASSRSSVPHWSAAVATTSLPQRRCGSPRAAQY
jgi:hypothetical protein